jgi:hypothetical protein
MNSNDFVSVNEILRDVGLLVNDEGHNRGVPQGQYVRFIKQAIEELAFDTYYQKIVKDLPMPANAIIDMPANTFNIENIYVFNGACEQPVDMRLIWYKRGYHRMDNHTHHTARRKENGSSDPYMRNESVGDDLYTATPSNGRIMFSTNCKNFAWVRLEANGMGGNVDELPIIPRMFRQAVMDYTRYKVSQVFTTKDPSQRFVLEFAYRDLYGDGSIRNKGSWYDAKSRIRSMETFIENSYKEYFSRMNF